VGEQRGLDVLRARGVERYLAALVDRAGWAGTSMAVRSNSFRPGARVTCVKTARVASNASTGVPSIITVAKGTVKCPADARPVITTSVLAAMELPSAGESSRAHSSTALPLLKNGPTPR
jgi:hypothetical protein